MASVSKGYCQWSPSQKSSSKCFHCILHLDILLSKARLPVCLSIFQPVYLSVCLSVFCQAGVWMSVYLSVPLSVFSIHLYLPVRPYLSVCLSIAVCRKGEGVVGWILVIIWPDRLKAVNLPHPHPGPPLPSAPSWNNGSAERHSSLRKDEQRQNQITVEESAEAARPRDGVSTWPRRFGL